MMDNFKINGTKLVAYCGDPEIEAVQIPYGITCIGPNSFSGYDCLKCVELPETVNEIAEHAFSDCEALEQINLPSSISTIGAYAFYGSHSLTVIDLPENLTFLGDNAFCFSGLKSIVIPGSIERIREGTFSYSDLEEVRILEGITVCEAAFVGCSELTTLHIPDSLSEMYQIMNPEINERNKFITDTFEFCENIKTICASAKWIKNNSHLLSRIKEAVKRAKEDANMPYPSSDIELKIRDTSNNCHSPSSAVQPKKTLLEEFDEAVSKFDEDEAIIYGADLLNEGNFLHVMLGFKKLAHKGFAQSKELYTNLLYRLSCEQRRSENFDFWQMTLNELNSAVGAAGFLNTETGDENIRKLKQELMCWNAVAKTKTLADKSITKEYHEAALSLLVEIATYSTNDSDTQECISFVNKRGIISTPPTKADMPNNPPQSPVLFFRNLFNKKNKSSNRVQEIDKYRELIRFIAFCQKTKPLLGGNYDIFILYNAPEKGQYSSRMYATFGFYDFDEIKFAREHAIRSSAGIDAQMVQFYYKQISDHLELNQQDWPYGIDAYDFAEVLRGTFCESFFILIPDEFNDDIFQFKVVGGSDSRNAIQVCNVVLDVLKDRFPELHIVKNHATPYSMGITIKI